MEKRFLISEMNFVIFGKLYTSYNERYVRLGNIDRLKAEITAERYDDIVNQIADELTAKNCDVDMLARAVEEIEKNAYQLTRFELHKIK